MVVYEYTVKGSYSNFSWDPFLGPAHIWMPPNNETIIEESITYCLDNNHRRETLQSRWQSEI